MSEVPVGDWHQEVRCKACGEMIDARAKACYLCGDDPQHDDNAALARAVHAEKVNSHLYGEGNAARRDHAATSRIPVGARGPGPSGNAYRGARGYGALVNQIKQSLREAGVGE